MFNVASAYQWTINDELNYLLRISGESPDLDNVLSRYPMHTYLARQPVTTRLDNYLKALPYNYRWDKPERRKLREEAERLLRRASYTEDTLQEAA